jgi:acetyl-CoA decarbonylase/synthase complex subunit epsilon
MKSAEPWQTAEIPGPKKALVITKPEIVAAMVKRAKHPILIVGHKAAETKLGEEETLIEYLIRLAKATNIPVVATAHVVKEFIDRGFQPGVWMPAVDIANRLQDPDWEGLDGEGQYDLALFTGIQYYMGWLILSGLKHFAPNVKTMSLDRFYQPNATWSFPNTSVEEWSKSVEDIVAALEAK